MANRKAFSGRYSTRAAIRKNYILHVLDIVADKLSVNQTSCTSTSYPAMSWLKWNFNAVEPTFSHFTTILVEVIRVILYLCDVIISSTVL